MDERLAAIARAMQGDSGRELDALITGLPDELDADLVLDLLRTLDDAAPWPEVAFGVVHAAESAPSDDYVRGLVRALPDLAEHAPGWAETLLARVMNSPDHLDLVCSAAGEATAAERAALVALSAGAAARDPERFGAAASAIKEAVSA